jgi:hypothetical protein
MKQSKTRKLAKAKAWKKFSEFIRRRDSDENGMGRCITCNKPVTWKYADAGHFISREKEATLFDEKNVHLQCKQCNGPKSGRQYEHGLAIDEMYGAGTAEKLLLKSKMFCQRKKWHYEEIAKEYKNKIEEL